MFLGDVRQPEVQPFSLSICLNAAKFVLLYVFNLIYTACLKIWGKPLLKNAKLPVDVPASKLSTWGYRKQQTRERHARGNAAARGSLRLPKQESLLAGYFVSRSQDDEQYFTFSNISIQNIKVIISIFWGTHLPLPPLVTWTRAWKAARWA